MSAPSGVVNIVNAHIPFEIVKEDGSSLNTAEEHVIVTKKIGNREMKIYHLFVKFEGQDIVTECTVAARSKEAAFRILQGVGNEAKKLSKPDFERYYEAAKANGTSFAPLINIDRVNGSEKIQLHIETVINGFSNRFFEPVHNEQDYTKDQMKILDNYARLFREIYLEAKQPVAEHLDVSIVDIDDAENFKAGLVDEMEE